MSDKEAPSSPEMPDDEHLREDVALASGEERKDSADNHYLPGQTNAGQQVAGLTPVIGYGDSQNHEEQDSDNPV